MRVYQIARELDRPHRAMLQLMRELGYDVPSHMARIDDEQETMIREAVERQERGAPTVRPVHTAGASVSAARVAEVVGTVELAEDTEFVAPATPIPPRPNYIGGGAITSRLPLCCMGLTTPAASIASIIRAARL